MAQNRTVYRVGDWVEEIATHKVFEITYLNVIQDAAYVKIIIINKGWTRGSEKRHYRIDNFRKKFKPAISARILYSSNINKESIK